MTMERPNIILTGFMGTGKTTVGKMLAEELGYDFVDTDALIAQKTGKTVPEIFQAMGEAAFREMEAAVARELAARRGVVIATGGRMMLDPDNAAALSRTGPVFCLVATPEEILERVARDTTGRPLLMATPDPLARIVALLRERREGYRRFPQIVTSGTSPEMIVRNLIARLASLNVAG